MVDFRKAMQDAYGRKRAPRLDLNPSAADRWTTCTASPHFILENWEKVPSDETKFNQEGTTAHEVAAALLQDRPPDAKDKYKCPTAITPEMHKHAWDYMEYVTGLIEPGGKLLVEQKLPLWYMPERNAIVDAAVINRESIHIIDFKYGEGVVVSPVENLQAVIYAESIAKTRVPVKMDTCPPITVHIFQPRGRAAEDAPTHTWQIVTDLDFRRFSELRNNIEFASDQIITSSQFLKFAPSVKACQWCPAKGFCPARQQHFAKDVEALATIPNGEKHLPPVKAVSVSQLSAILKHKADIIRWLNDAEAYALQHLSAGGTIPGWKLVLSRGGNRYWSNPKQAARLLMETHLRRDEVIEEKVISPAQAETLLGKNRFNAELTKLITRTPGVPTIAAEEDKRESCLIDPVKEFADI